MPSLPPFDYFFCFQPAEFGTNSIQFSRGASLDPTSTSFASTNNSTNRESSGAVFEGRRGGEIGREIRERERGRSGGRSQDRVGSSLSPFEFVKQRREGTRLIAVRIIFTIRVTERNKLELKKKREIGDNSRQLFPTLGKKTKRIYSVHNTNNTLSVSALSPERETNSRALRWRCFIAESAR